MTKTVFISKTHNSSLIMRKMEKSQLRDIHIPENYQGHQNRESLRTVTANKNRDISLQGDLCYRRCTKRSFRKEDCDARLGHSQKYRFSKYS
jgi:hypothetical protein